MTDKSELKRFFDRELSQNIAVLQKRMNNKIKIMYVTLFGWLMVIGIVFFDMHHPLFLGSTFIVVISGTLLWIGTPEKQRSLLDQYQRVLAMPILEKIDPAMRYRPSSGLSANEVLRSSIFDHVGLKIQTNNLVLYELEGIPVRLSHVDILQQDSNGDYAPVLIGLMAVTTARRKIKGTTIVSFDFLEKKLGFVGKGLQRKVNRNGLKQVYLDNTSFEKEFTVYSSDPVEANYLLSHTVMEKLTTLIKRYRLYVYITFVQDKLYIAVNNGHGFFQASPSNGFKGQLSDFKHVEHNIDALYLVRNIINEVQFHHQN